MTASFLFAHSYAEQVGRATRSFITKAIDFLRNGINLVMVDLFPPTPRDPEGIYQLIWDELVGAPFEARPPDKPLTVAGYDAVSR